MGYVSLSLFRRLLVYPLTVNWSMESFKRLHQQGQTSILSRFEVLLPFVGITSNVKGRLEKDLFCLLGLWC